MKWRYGLDDEPDIPVSDGRMKQKMKPKGAPKMGRLPPDYDSRLKVEREKSMRRRKTEK